VITGGLGLAAATGFLASNPVGWGVAAGLAVGGLAWWGLQELTPDGMETTEWIATWPGEVANFAGDVGSNVADFAGDAWESAGNAAEDVVDGAAEFVDDVTSPLRDLFSFG
jgi:hypothetical protein